MSENMMSSEVTSDDRLWAGLSYVIPIFAIIALLMEDKKNREYIKSHVYQALITGLIAGFLGPICIGFLLWLVMLYWGYQAYQGESVEIPIITDFVKNQGWV